MSEHPSIESLVLAVRDSRSVKIGQQDWSLVASARKDGLCVAAVSEHILGHVPALLVAASEEDSPDVFLWQARFDPWLRQGSFAPGSHFWYATKVLQGRACIAVIPFIGTATYQGVTRSVLVEITEEDIFRFATEFGPDAASLWTQLDELGEWRAESETLFRSHCPFPIPALPKEQPIAFFSDSFPHPNRLILRFGNNTVLWCGATDSPGKRLSPDEIAFEMGNAFLRRGERVVFEDAPDFRDRRGGYAWARIVSQ